MLTYQSYGQCNAFWSIGLRLGYSHVLYLFDNTFKFLRPNYRNALRLP